MLKLSKRLSLILVFALILSFSAMAAADDTDIFFDGAPSEEDILADQQNAANLLNGFGLFMGTDSGYELEKTPTRAQAAAMLVRLLGKDSEALSYDGGHPFNDVPEWAQGYVSYLYNNNIALGVAEDMFGSDNPCESRMFVTFVLRALGYSDLNGDFKYSNSISFALMEGVLPFDYADRLTEAEFTRGDLALISNYALFSYLEDGSMTLFDKLMEDGVLTSDFAKKLSVLNTAEDMLDFGWFQIAVVGSYELSVSREATYSMAGYAPLNYRSVLDIKVTDVFAYPQFERIQTEYVSGEKYVTTVYTVDGYDYVLLPDGTKLKEESDMYDTSYEEVDSDALPLYERYESCAIEEKDGFTYIKRTPGEVLAMERAIDCLIWFGYDFDELTENDYVLLIKECEEEYVINPDGYLEEETEIITLDFMLKGEEKVTISLTTTTEYSNQGEPVTFDLPDDLDTYPEYEEEEEE